MVRPVDVDTAVTIGADALGFVFYPKSPRYLGRDEALRLRRRLPSYVAAVGLFVDAPAVEVQAAVEALGLDVVQFHGDESPGQCAAGAGGVPFWRAVRMRDRGDLLESARLFGAAEALLLDSYSAAYGGTGKRFDWSWIDAQQRGGARLILSGGLDAESVGEAILSVAPVGVDVSSGIQGTDPRTKESAKMERFVAAVIEADARRAIAGSETKR